MRGPIKDKRAYALAQQRKQDALRMSREGKYNRKDAANALGMTEAGLRSLLYREFDSERWPIREENT